MGILSLFRHEDRQTAPPEPKLSPEILMRYRELSSKERRRVLHEADESATASVGFDPSRDFEGERNAYIELELGGTFATYAAAVKENLLSERWKGALRVVVGQDDTPNGPWGWMIIREGDWPPTVLQRVPVAFATRDEASAAGDRAADALWSRMLAGSGLGR